MKIQQVLHSQLNAQRCLLMIPASNTTPLIDSKPVNILLSELASKIYEFLSENTKSNHKPPLTTYWILLQLNRHFRDKHVYNKADHTYTAAGNELLNTLHNLHAILHGKYHDDTRKLDSTEQGTLIAEKLCEEIAECTKGFHDRVNIIWSSLFVPRNFTERLYKIRYQIVQQVADTLAAQFCHRQKTAEAHVHNQITRIAHALGCGTNIENPHDEPAVLEDIQIRETNTQLIQAFQNQFTPLLIIQQIENQLHDQLLTLGYESRRIEAGYDNDSYNPWPDFLNTIFPAALSEDRDFTYWLITDSSEESDEDSYAPIKVLDIDWMKVRKAIYRTFVNERFVKQAPKELEDLPYNPKNSQEYQYWISKIASQDALLAHLKEKQRQYLKNPSGYREFMIQLALLVPKELDFYAMVVEQLAANTAQHSQVLLITITNSELLADFIDAMPREQWTNIHIPIVLSQLVIQKNPTLLQQFLMHVPASMHPQICDQISSAESVLSTTLRINTNAAVTKRRGYALTPHLLHMIDFCIRQNIDYPAHRWLEFFQLDRVDEQGFVTRIITTDDYTDAKNLLQLTAMLYARTDKLVPWHACLAAAFTRKPALISAILSIVTTYEPSIQLQLLTKIQPNLIHAALEHAPESLSCIIPWLEKLGGEALIQEQIFAPAMDVFCNNALHRLFVSQAPWNSQSLDNLLRIITRYLSEELQKILFDDGFSWQVFLSKQPSLEQIAKLLVWQKSLNIPLAAADNSLLRTFYFLDLDLLTAELEENTDSAENHLRLKLALNTCRPEQMVQYIPLMVEYCPDQLADLLLSTGMNQEQFRTIISTPFDAAKEAYLNALEFVFQKKPDAIILYMESVLSVTTKVQFLLDQNLRLERVPSPQNIMQILQILKEKDQPYTLSMADKQHLNDRLSDADLRIILGEGLIPEVFIPANLAALSSNAVHEFSWQTIHREMQSCDQMYAFLAAQPNPVRGLESFDKRMLRIRYQWDARIIHRALEQSKDLAEKMLRLKLAMHICEPAQIVQYIPVILQHCPDQLEQLLLSGEMNPQQFLMVINAPFYWHNKAYANLSAFILQNESNAIMPYINMIMANIPQPHGWLAQNIRITQMVSPEKMINVLRIFKEQNQAYNLSKEDKLHLNRYLSAADWYTISKEGLISAKAIQEKKEIILQHISKIDNLSERYGVIKDALNAQTELGSFFGTQRGFFKCRITAGTWKKLDQMLPAKERDSSLHEMSF